MFLYINLGNGKSVGNPVASEASHSHVFSLNVGILSSFTHKTQTF